MFYNLYLNAYEIDTNFFVNAFIVPIGIFSNLISIKIFSKRSLNCKTNIGYYHLALCAFNLLPLLNSIFLTQLFPFFNIKVMEYSNFACKFFSFWNKFSIDGCSFQQVLITILLFLSVKFPIRFVLLQNRICSVILQSSIVLLSLLVNTPFWFYELKSENDLANETNQTNISICYASINLGTISILSNIFIRYIIPLFLISIFNFLILYHFYLGKRLSLAKKLKKPRNFLLSMYVINVLFFIFHLPWCISYIMIVYLNYYTISIKDSNYSLVYFYNISLAIAYLNNTSTFFVHVIFNKLFRKEFLSTFRLKKLVKKFRI